VNDHGDDAMLAIVLANNRNWETGGERESLEWVGIREGEGRTVPRTASLHSSFQRELDSIEQ